MKKLLLLLIPAVAFAQPKAVHYSALGNYLVDQDGNKTTIQGHPHMVCYTGTHEIRGKFQKARGSVVYLIGYDDHDETKSTHYFLIPNAVCDLK